MTTEPWLIVTPEQLKGGWLERRHNEAINTIRRDFEVIRQLDGGNYCVRNPALTLLEEEQRQESR